MDRQFINKVLGEVRKRMKTFEAAGCRQSRRIEGMYDRDNEIHGFKNLCIYVDAGVVGREMQIAEILGAVDCHIYGNEHYNHTRWLMFFGAVPDRFITPGPSSLHRGIRASDWEGSLRKHISSETLPEALFIPKMVNSEASRTRSPDSHDLGLVFCRTRELFVKNEEEQKRFKQLGTRLIWIFFGDDELPEMESAGFIPQVIAGCNMPE